jgi:HTH-type transcriptional regulator/antitoxin HigA
MIKRGWLRAESVRDVQAVQSELTKFFGVNRVEDIEGMPHAAKRTEISSEATPTQIAWLYRVRQIARDMLVAKYSQPAARSVLGKLKPLMHSPEEIRKVPRILAEAGIRFLIVEALPSSKIDGVCFWLNDNAPVVALSLRFDRIDNFWFVLRHELEHVFERHGLSKMMLDADVENDGVAAVSNEERAANQAATEFCVPVSMMDAFVARKAPFFREADIIALSRMLKVHPGIVAGQLRRRLNRYDRFNNHLAKIRHIITPNAISDGWGDLAPLGI